MEFGYDTLCDFASLEARGSYTKLYLFSKVQKTINWFVLNIYDRMVRIHVAFFPNKVVSKEY
jgi:hypothetical protein